MAFCGYLKQSTAVDILLGPFVDDSDGKTAETGLALDVELSKNGQALANKNDADTATHDSAGDIDGFYNCELDTTDTNTLGILTVCAYASGALVCRQDYQVVTANWYDTMCSTEKLDVNVKEVSDDATAADTLELFVEALDQATGQLDSGTLHDDTITAASINTGALTADAFAADALIAATFATDCITTDAFADGTITSDKLGADCITSAKIADNALANEHFAAGALTSTEITSAAGITLADDAITAAKFDESTAYPLKSADTGATAIARTGADSDTLETLSDQLDDIPTVAEFEARTIAAADYFDPAADTVAQVTLVDTCTTNTDMVASAPSAADIADAVWDEAIAGHAGVGSTGEQLAAAGAAGDPWATALPGAYGAGTAGKIVGDNINAPVGTVDTVVDAIKADLDDGGRLDLLIDAIKAKTDMIVLNDIADAILKRDMSAVSGESARSLLNAIRFLRNKWSISGTTLTVTKEDDTTEAWTSTVTGDAAADPIVGSDPA